jgi:[ribosomal protein S18]-alanine N-acetyltransferase
VLPARPLLPTQLDQVLEIEQQIYPYPWTSGNFRDAMLSGYDVWGSLEYEGGPLMGYFVAAPMVDEVHLLNLSIAPSWQGLGHGRALLAQVTERHFLNGMESVLLEVRPSNVAARALYEKFGFIRIGVRRGYYPGLEQGREDALVMRLPLKPWHMIQAG